MAPGPVDARGPGSETQSRCVLGDRGVKKGRRLTAYYNNAAVFCRRLEADGKRLFALKPRQ
eukprot:COSAG02_NODE_58599_length_277_cov_0.550562_1_plen_60_part_10